jgi:hypothetical protein
MEGKQSSTWIGSEKSASPEPGPQTVFLSYPGFCTGDVWHTAAACLLAKKDASYTSMQWVILFTLPSNTPDIADSKYANMFDYFQRLNLRCLLVKLPAAITMGDEWCEEVAPRIEPQDLAICYNDQLGHCKNGTHYGKGFRTLWESLQPVKLSAYHVSKHINVKGLPKHVWPPLHHYTHTTLLASFMRRCLQPGQTNMPKLKLLRNQHHAIALDAQAKITQLRQLIRESRVSTGAGFESATAILFIYRATKHEKKPNVGSFLMNPHQDATMGLFEQVQEIARRRGFVTIRVPQGLDARRIRANADLDIFDELASLSQSQPGLAMKDRRFLPCFWSQLAAAPDLNDLVFGIIGPRTGTLDVAAFAGLRCFEWDEPLCEELAGQTSEARRQHLDSQLPQHLRLMMQGSFMSIGLLDIHSFDKSASRYEKLLEEPLQRWMSGAADVFPTPVASKQTVRERSLPTGSCDYNMVYTHRDVNGLI